MTDLMTYLARAGKSLTAPVGPSIVVEIPHGWSDAAAMLVTPRYPKEEEIPLRPADDSPGLLKYDRADEAGVYSLQMRQPGGDQRQVLLARNIDPAEGDLTPSGQGLLTAAFGGEEFTYRPMESATEAANFRSESSKEYWIYLAAALLGLLALELYLGQRFGHYTSSDGSDAGGRA